MRALLLLLALTGCVTTPPADMSLAYVELAPDAQGVARAEGTFEEARLKLEAAVDEGRLAPRYRLEGLVYVNRALVALRDIRAAYADEDTVKWAWAWAHLQKNVGQMNRLATEPQP